MIEVHPVAGLPEIAAGDDLAELIAGAADLRDRDVVVVTSKVVSKAEGRLVAMPRAEAIATETVRVVARRDDTRIVETRHGLVLAAAGVDASNVPPGTVALLPVDPDASARGLRDGLQARTGARVAVVVSDTLGRPWRRGETDVAIGAAGIAPMVDYRGRTDAFGTPLAVTEIAVADEVAAAAELVMGKLAGIPVAVVRGLAYAASDVGSRALVRTGPEDLFPLGARDVVPHRRTVRAFTAEPVEPGLVRRAIRAALTAPAPRGESPWRFVLVESPAARRAVVAEWSHAVLEDAPYVVVPCLVAPDAEREAYLMAAGAAVEALLVALAVEGLGSAWVPRPAPDVERLRTALALRPNWAPVGAVAIGYPAVPPPVEPPELPDATDVTVVR